MIEVTNHEDVKEVKNPRVCVSVEFGEFCDLLALQGRVDACIEYVKSCKYSVDKNAVLKMLGCYEPQAESESE